MARNKLVRPQLPPEDDDGYLEAAVDASILVFEKLQDDKLALDYMGIKGKFRPLVLKHTRYLQVTRMKKAELMMDEIEDIEDMIDELNKEEQTTQRKLDIRNMDQKEINSFAKDSKDRFAQMMKLKDRRADLRSMSREQENEEVDALNIMFIALTAEEFYAMQNAEINEGSDEDTGALIADKKDKEIADARNTLDPTEERVPFRTDSEGNLIGTS